MILISSSFYAVPAQVGQRVVRGPGWKCGNDDGGEGHVGTIQRLGGNENTNYPKDTVFVVWDSGIHGIYRTGSNDIYELRLFDNAATGVIHTFFVCDECKDDGILGIRWKCLVCTDYDLCSKCYMNGKHNRSHRFKRIDTPADIGVDVPKRKKLHTTEARGIFTGAKVTRGVDWEFENSDGGEGSVGVLIKTTGYKGTPGRDFALVYWEKTGQTLACRLGHRGKMDIKFVESASGGQYYRDHLPVIGGVSQDDPLQINVGDKVKILLEADVLESMQQGHGNWNSEMAQYIGKIGTVQSITSETDIVVQYEDSDNLWTFHKGVLTKVVGSTIVPGAKVLISADMDLVKQLQSGHGEWLDEMVIILGKIGKVLKIDADGDVLVKAVGVSCLLNPRCLTLVPGAPLEPATEEDSEVDSEDSENDSADAASNPLAELIRLHPSLGQLIPDSSKDLVAEAAKGDVDSVRQILKEHPHKVNEENSGKTALHMAALKGHKVIVELLLDANANMEIRDGDGDTPLHYAALGDDPEILELLLKKGASMNGINKAGVTTLQMAIAKQQVTFVKMLIKYNCNVNMQDFDGDTALHYAIEIENLEIVDLLMGIESLNFSLSNRRGFNVLHQAALKGNNFIMQHILEKTMEMVDLAKEDGFTPLHVAAINGHRLVAETLIQKGKCNINAKNKTAETPLYLAVSQLMCGVVELLVNKGAHLDEQDDDGDSPLHIAILKSFTNLTKTSEATDVDASAILEIFETLKSQKLGEVHLAVACFLVQNGADLNLKNKKGETPLDCIPVHKVKDVVISYSLKTIDRNSNSSPVLSRSVSADLDICSLCSEEPAVICFEPCGHKVACEKCSLRVKRCILCHAVVMKKVAADGQLISNPSLRGSTDKLEEISENEESQRCSICMNAIKNVAFLCGHRACSDCAQNLQTCHICRKPITRKIDLF